MLFLLCVARVPPPSQFTAESNAGKSYFHTIQYKWYKFHLSALRRNSVGESCLVPEVSAWLSLPCELCIVSVWFMTTSGCNITDQPSAAIDEEVYDDVDSASFPPLPPLSRCRPNLKPQKKPQSHLYICPPLPSIFPSCVCNFHCHSLPNFKGKSKSEDAELKRQKKMEKEEKEFRKKFKVCLSLLLM